MRCFAGGFVVGCLALQLASRLPEFRPLALACVAIGLAAALLRSRAGRLALVAAAGVLAGVAWSAWRAEVRLADALPFEAEGIDLTVTGIVEALPTFNERGVRFLLRVEEGAAPSLIALSWYATGDKPHLVPAQRWRMTVRLKRPRGLANPHAFDFEAWALQHAIRATGYVREKPPPEMLAARVDGCPQTLHRWRGDVRASMEAALAGRPAKGVLVALAIGDQDAIDPVSWDTFWRTGVGHLMSISGLHITMLAALAFVIVAWCWARVPGLPLAWPARKAGAIAGVLAALAYTLMTGYAVPAQRTLLMVATMALCVVVGRQSSPSRMLAVAALAVLLVDPWAVLSPGFWLSFGAVAAILGAVSGRADQAPKWQAAVREQAVVTLAMIPLLAALFQEMSLVSPLANAIAIPVVSLVVVPLTLAGAFLGVDALLHVADALMTLLMAPLDRMAAWPLAMVEVAEPSPAILALAVIGCAWLLAPRGVPLRSFGVLAMLPLTVLPPPRPSWGAAWIDVLDVGNGLAVVVRTQAHALVFDAGPAWSGDTDSGERIVAPYLRGEGVRELDLLIVSHADDDHAGGAISVATSRMPPRLMSSLPPEDALHGLVEASAPCHAGTSWRWEGVAFTVLHPAVARSPDARKENDRSCVLRIATAGGAAVIAADVEARSEREMLARDRAGLRADVLVVPHHGSRTSSTPAFIDAVWPREAIFTVGYRNRFRHPHPQVVERYAARGARIWRSDRDGALRATLPATATEQPVVERLVTAVRYWSDRR